MDIVHKAETYAIIIDRHADHLLREVDGLGWENDAPSFVEEIGPTTY